MPQKMMNWKVHEMILLILMKRDLYTRLVRSVHNYNKSKKLSHRQCKLDSQNFTVNLMTCLSKKFRPYVQVKHFITWPYEKKL